MSATAEVSQLELNIPGIPQAEPAAETDTPQTTAEKRREAIGIGFQNLRQSVGRFFSKAEPVIDFVLEIDERTVQGAQVASKYVGDAVKAAPGAAVDLATKGVVAVGKPIFEHAVVPTVLAAEAAYQKVDEKVITPVVEASKTVVEYTSRNWEKLTSSVSNIANTAIESVKRAGSELDYAFVEPYRELAEEMAAAPAEIGVIVNEQKKRFILWNSTRALNKKGKESAALTEEYNNNLGDPEYQDLLARKIKTLEQEMDNIVSSSIEAARIAREKSALCMEQRDIARRRVRDGSSVRAFFRNMLNRKQSPQTA